MGGALKIISNTKVVHKFKTPYTLDEEERMISDSDSRVYARPVASQKSGVGRDFF